MLKRMYVRFLLWALGPMREANAYQKAKDICATNEGGVVRKVGGLGFTVNADSFNVAATSHA